MSSELRAAFLDIGIVDALYLPDIRMLELWLDRICECYDDQPDAPAASSVPASDVRRQAHAWR
ncbi:MAG: hypothetical protein ACK4IU_15800 [Tabrizicola flagellatus]|uniref:hypothetical protein n=1 Tax=Tabrizicola flagellatus TaxID=2593021 RepID=UPI003919FCB4